MDGIATRLDFEDPRLLDALGAEGTRHNDAGFGVVGMDREGRVVVYNDFEARAAGLPAASVLGEDFFGSVALCMNNFMVAQRFEDEETLDATIDYVLTLRMRPTRVRLRLLQAPRARLRYVLVERS